MSFIRIIVNILILCVILNAEYICDPEVCLIENNCYCASKKIPGNLELTETPQFIILNFDDSFNERLMPLIKNLDFLLKNEKILDSNDCFLRPSIYYTADNSDFYYAKYFESFQGSVNLHTTTHRNDIFKSGKDRWLDELSTNFKSLIELGWVNEIKGSRAPHLNFDNDYFEVLQAMGMKYDSSIKDDEYYWPFTLNNGLPNDKMCQTAGECLTKRYNGLWEFPLYYVKDTEGNIFGTSPQDPPIKDETLTILIEDFEKTYNSNRVPRGIYTHPQYFTSHNDFSNLDVKKIEVFSAFYEYIAKKQNVLFATEDMIIDWIKNPLPYSQTKNLPQFQCPLYKSSPSAACPVTRCDVAWVKTCGPLESCPNYLPQLGNINWSKFTGNTNNYDRNNDFKGKNEPEPTPTPTPSPVHPDFPKNTVVVNGKAVVKIDRNWNKGLCASLQVSFSENISIKSFLISLKICGNKFYGEKISTKNFLVRKNPAVYQTVINYQGVTYSKDKIYSPVELCLNYYSDFDTKDLMASVIFFDQYLECNEKTCKPKCGDGICDKETENEENCQVDCKIC